jgi:hypothetical protein
MQQCIKIYFIFIWSSTCFERHTAYHQKPKTALAASGFACVEGCWTCSWRTLGQRLHFVHHFHTLSSRFITPTLFLKLLLTMIYYHLPTISTSSSWCTMVQNVMTFRVLLLYEYTELPKYCKIFVVLCILT